MPMFIKSEYQDYGVPPPRQDDYGQNSYGNSGNFTAQN